MINGIDRVVNAYIALKSLPRQGWLDYSLPSSQRCESVAEHSFGVALLVYVIGREYHLKINLERAMSMALVHDLPEKVHGDITPADKYKFAHKEELEMDGRDRVLGGLEGSKLWDEFNENTTPEANFVNQCDKLEMGLQALVYKMDGDIMADAKKKVVMKELREILDWAERTHAI